MQITAIHLVLIASLFVTLSIQWNADAGLVFGYQKGASATATTESSDDHSADQAIDGDTNTYWEGAYCGSNCACQNLTVDLGSSKQVGLIYIRTWSSVTPVTDILLSADGSNWQHVVSHPTPNFNGNSYPLDNEIPARYVLVSQCLKSGKGTVRELEVYDKNGQWGSPSASNSFVNPNTYQMMVGVNGIWQWGQTPYCNSTTFSRILSIARNYHNLGWDLDNPDETLDFSHFPTGQGGGGAWLNWDAEYTQWRNGSHGVKGFDEITASIQFTNTGAFAVANWKNPYQTAYSYGKEFAKHFGPTHGNGLVTYLEIGNEPWNFPADFMKEVTAGMGQGCKDGDPKFQVLTGALQADSPETPTSYQSSGGNYMGARLNATIAKNIDVINVHAYSFMTSPIGASQTIATWPEDKRSGMGSVRNALRFRDVNMPGKKVFLTEWGWDGVSPYDDPACPYDQYHYTCVTAEGQALYAMRGTLMLAREGLDRIIWYDFSNIDGTTPLFSRSGLVSGHASNFQPLESYNALRTFLSTLGKYHHVGVVLEDSQARVYLLGDNKGNAELMVAWRPVNVSVTDSIDVSFPSRWISSGSVSRLSASSQDSVNLGDVVKQNSTHWTLTITKNILIIPGKDGSPGGVSSGIDVSSGISNSNGLSNADVVTADANLVGFGIILLVVVLHAIL